MTNNQGNLSHLILTERILSPHTTLSSCWTTHGNLSHLMSSERISSPLGTLISCLTMLVISWNTPIMFFNSHLIHEVQKIQNYILKLRILSSQENTPTATSAQKKKSRWFFPPLCFLSSRWCSHPCHLLGIWRELTTDIRHLHLSKTNGFGDLWKMFSLITHVLQKMVKIFWYIWDVI